MATTLQVAERPRAFVGVRGPDAAAYLNRMVSNEVEELATGEACEALLLTPKARVIATLTVWRRAGDDFLLLTEPETGDRLARELARARFAARCDIGLEEHSSLLVLGDPDLVAREHEVVVPNHDYGVPAAEVLDIECPPGASLVAPEELERLRIRARTPRLGLDIDDRVLPAEAGLDERAISFTKGCYPGQEPVARLHYRGHANRALRLLAIAGSELPARDAELVHGGKVVGRITSAALDPDDGVVALAYVRREVPADAVLQLGASPVRQLPRASRPSS